MPSEDPGVVDINELPTEEVDDKKIYPDSEGFFTLPCSDLTAEKFVLEVKLKDLVMILLSKPSGFPGTFLIVCWMLM